jgi:hypothetical protein
VDFGRCGLAARVQDVHDLPFTTAQFFFIFHANFAVYAKNLAYKVSASRK